MRRLVDSESLIDAIEVGPDFVTVYINSTEPGQEGSVQRQFLDEFHDLIEDPSYHDPIRFHDPGDPRGSKWRTWEHKYACHFHICGDVKHILEQLINRADISPKLRKQLHET